MNCLITGCQRPAEVHQIYGVMPCLYHQKERRKNNLPYQQVEFTTDDIKEGRKEYFKSTLQPWRNHQPSKEFIESYPEESKEMFTESEIKHAKEVWTDLPNAKNWRQTK